ncbi:hypothetical protein [Plantactinospora sp. KBS50]|uniref:hypothetical protein n=1 Tax=Plantactinospora sp. KBS50 TaxID=2024580 RepID=UPI000BAAA939|nr:hypothetical protein [Plantactinospora sp. KBS50]ASW53922.1 hypothetical protein CIK06_06600 [Plantactinospora sp. KBS50]
MTVDDRLAADERMTLKTAAYGAVFLVSNAEPGPFAMIKESFAASDTIAGSSGLVRDVLTTGPLPQLPADPVAVKEVVLPALRRSVELLREHAPAELGRYQATVVAAAHQVARASAGTSEAEATALAEVLAALEVTP